MTIFYREEKKIIQWLTKQKVNDYDLELSEKFGFIVNVSGDVLLSGEERDFILRNIPVKFGVIAGRFDCHENELKDLDFAPSYVSGRFKCSNNKIKSLKNCPEYVGGDFNCNDNELTTLEYAPKKVGGTFLCANNFLTSLQYCPDIISQNFSCSGNDLQTLLYCPQSVQGVVNYAENPGIGDYQKIRDFSVFKEEALRLQSILDLQERLTAKLNDSEKYKKIKI